MQLNQAELDDRFIHVQQYIQDHFTSDLALDEVADQVGLNPVYFCRLFKQEIGVTFVEYVTRLRIERAMDLLHSHKYKANEISEMVGFRSSQYFTKVFKETTGYTPISYRRKENPYVEDVCLTLR